MPISVAFTITATLALILHGRWLWERILISQARETKKINGHLSAVARLFVQVEATRFLLNLVLFVSGAGILLHQPKVAYLLATLPLISIISSLLWLRGVRE